MQVIRQIAEESIPRSAENMALALGAFCLVINAQVVYCYHHFMRNVVPYR